MVTTKGLVALVQGNQAPYLLFDVLGQPEMLPNAIPAAWLAQAGSFNNKAPASSPSGSRRNRAANRSSKGAAHRRSLCP